MRRFRIMAALVAGVAVTTFGIQADELLLDRLGDALSFSTADGAARVRVRGLVDLEGYYAPDVRADLRFTGDDFLLHPRAALFLDGQLGARGYGFAQARVDRGFDPRRGASWRVRLDEYALRLALAPRGALHLQLGKFATVAGNWTARHHAWENPFITAPLPYENLTAIWDDAATTSVEQLRRRAHVEPASGNAGLASDKHRRVPIIWGPSYGTGAAVAGALGRFEYALEAKNAALSARPGQWDHDDRPWGAPTWTGRAGWRPDERWNLGVSASRGAYLTRAAIPTILPGRDAGDHQQTLLAADVAFARRHLQWWAEVQRSRFHVPGIGGIHTTAYYLEAKYKFRPQWFGAVRWNQQFFSHAAAGDGRRVRWGREVSRLDIALIHRLSAHLQLKLQYSPQRETPAPRELTHALAAQFTTRF